MVMTIRNLFYASISMIKYQRMVYVYFRKLNAKLKKFKYEPLPAAAKLRIKNKFKAYGYKGISTKWHQYYSGVNNKLDDNYIPELVYYSKIEPVLNQSIMFPALEDKNLLDNFFSASLLPKVIIKNINGFYYDNKGQQIGLETALDRCCQFSEWVIKPSVGTSGGKRVKKMILKELKSAKDDLRSLFEEYHSDFIVQELIKQNAHLSKLNPSSLNTIRMMSYMRQDEVVPLSSLIRIGKSGSFTDNVTIGGMACGINEDGRLKKLAVDEYGNRYCCSDHGTELHHFEIPMFHSAIALVKKLHKQMPHFKIISWDLAIDDKSEVRLIEFNALGQGINMHQESNGPLFGEYTDEILSLAQREAKFSKHKMYGKYDS